METLLQILMVLMGILVFLVLFYTLSRLMAFAFVRTIKDEISKILNQKGMINEEESEREPEEKNVSGKRT